MNEPKDQDEKLTVAKESEPEDVVMLDLGNAKKETLQSHPFPLRVDSGMQIGWG